MKASDTRQSEHRCAAETCGNYGTTGQKTEKEKKTPPPNLKSQGDISQAEEGLWGRVGGEFPLRRSISEKQRGKSAQLLLEYASGSVEQETETIRR